MFGVSDKHTLSAINFTDSKGKIMDARISFPVEGEIVVPKDTRAVDIFEGINGMSFYRSFSIYVGYTTTLLEFVKKPGKISLIYARGDFHPAEDTIVCYDTPDKAHYVLARVDEGDFVVKDYDELIKLLNHISDTYKNVREDVASLRKKK